MREMHKWKDKVELSLDNRQIFFLFFGLSVVGCFVFALGVMVGRRVDFGQTGEVAAIGGEGLDLLRDDVESEEPAPLAFKDGLKNPANADVPPTRDPSQPPAAEEEFAAAKKAQAAADEADEDDDEAPAPHKSKKPNPVAGAEAPVLAQAAKPAKASDKPAPSKASTSPVGRKFTLQMKAFSRPEEAEAFAAPLRANGHDIRIEAQEVKGRLWHRVRMGEFKNWEDGLAAKTDFESKEEIIAYVVRM